MGPKKTAQGQPNKSTNKANTSNTKPVITKKTSEIQKK